MCVDEPMLGNERENRARKNADDVKAERDPESDGDANDGRAQRINDSPAQLLEVIEERHLSARGLRNTHDDSDAYLALPEQLLGKSGFIGGCVVLDHALENGSR